MFNRILILVLLVLFTSMSCKQNTAALLSSTPTTEDDGTIDNNTGSGNTDGGIVDNGTDSSYGVYNVSTFINDEIKTIPLRISETYEMFMIYSSMILNDEKESKFKLYKNNTTSATAEGSETTVSDIYTFDENLNIIKEETTDGASKNTASPTICKKFRGVCIVRIYPDAKDVARSSLLGEYTIAGVYTEMEENTAAASYMAMGKTDMFQNYGYDELIILRHDEQIDITSASTASAVKYRADILFNDDEGISFYYYDPDRTFQNQNTNYIFERIVAETTTK